MVASAAPNHPHSRRAPSLQTRGLTESFTQHVQLDRTEPVTPGVQPSPRRREAAARAEYDRLANDPVLRLLPKSRQLFSKPRSDRGDTVIPLAFPRATSALARDSSSYSTALDADVSTSLRVERSKSAPNATTTSSVLSGSAQPPASPKTARPHHPPVTRRQQKQHRGVIIANISRVHVAPSAPGPLPLSASSLKRKENRVLGTRTDGKQSPNCVSLFSAPFC